MALGFDCQVFCTHSVFAHAECALIYFFKLEQKFFWLMITFELICKFPNQFFKNVTFWDFFH
jgi:hypothetical protein